MMVFLRSLLFNVAFYGWTALWGIIAFFTLLLPRKCIFFPQVYWSKGMQRLVRVAGIRVEFRGLHHLRSEPVLIASKHQSAWDTTAFFGIAGPVAVVMKQELLWLPVIGWYLRRCEEIPVDREAGAKALRAMLKAAEKAVAKGRSILIFPEGTRTAAGKDAPFLPGVAALYTMLDLDVVPVALNSGLVWPRRSFMKYPGTIVMEFLPPIHKGLGKERFMKRLKSDIENATARLVYKARRAKKKP